MPQARFSQPAIRDLERLRELLRHKSPVAAKRAGEVIVKAVQVLGLQPGLGRPFKESPTSSASGSSTSAIAAT